MLNPKLTPREEEIVRLVAKGKPNKLIAYEMGLTYGSVKQYLYAIFQKVGVTNRTELALSQASAPSEASQMTEGSCAV